MTEINDNFFLNDLDDFLSPRVRLGIMAILIVNGKSDFSFLKDRLGATSGNLSSHLSKLEEGGYISSVKSFLNKKPRSTYRATEKGKKAFSLYIETIEKIANNTLK